MSDRLPPIPDFEPILALIEPVTEQFKSAGYQLHLVGGVVRDIALGGHGKLDDIDLTTDARPNEIKALLAPISTALWTQGERFGTIGAVVSGRDLEVTTFRAESYDPDSRKPTVDFGDDLLADLSRRDFSINAMAYSAIDRELIDPFGGRDDLEQRLLRTPEDPEQSFVDDPLRMLRAARFIPRFVLSVDADLELAVRRLGTRLSIVSRERIHDELERLLAVEEPWAGFDFMVRTGLLSLIVPELVESAGTQEQIDLACKSASKPGSVKVRRAALIYQLGPDGAASWLSDLRYSNADRRITLSLLKAVGLVGEWPCNEASVRRVVKLVGLDEMTDVLRLARNVLVQVAREDHSNQLPERLRAFESKFGELAGSENLNDLASPVSGGDLIKALGISPGPLIGEAVQMLETYRLDNGPIDESEAIIIVKNWLAGR